MKYVKMLGLAAVAAAALMAFVGASSASATVLCKTTPPAQATTGTTCPANQAYPAGTEIHAVNVGVVSLHASFKTVECNKSTISGTTEQEGDATHTVTGAVASLTFEECNCEVVVLKKGTQELHWIPDTHNGTLTANGQEVTVSCESPFGKVHCIYITTNKDLGEVTASATSTSPAIFHADATVERKETNLLCNETSTWTATYEITSPKPLYVADHT